MKNSITEILAELYLLDPALKKQEAELMKLLEKMTANKPETHFDEVFKTELKSKLMKEIAQSKKTGQKINWMSVLTGFFAGGSAIGFAGYAFMQVFVPAQIPMIQPETSVTTSQTLATNPIDFGFNKTEKGSAAFGTLSTVGSSSSGDGMNAVSAKIPSSRGVVQTGVSSLASPEISSAETTGATLKIASPDARMMIAPFEQKIYNYIYSGSGFTVDAKEMTVFQKKKNTITTDEAQGFLKNFKISSIDLGGFSALKLGNISLMEDREYGLGLSVDFNEGTLGISKNWTQWPQEICKDGVCPMIKIEEAPSDDKAIEIADTFLKKFKIALTSYGKPVVNTDWKKEYEHATDKTLAWIPNSVSVVYPLVIEGKEVLEEYGQPKGITVSIDVKTGLVTDVYGMEKLDFDASNYTTEANVTKILEVAKNGGRTWNFAAGGAPVGDEKNTTINVQLGEPKMSYVHLNDYQSGMNKEYLVPALVFPVLDSPKEGEYFQSTVIVPIIQEFFTRKDSPIMPMIKSAR